MIFGILATIVAAVIIGSGFDSNDSQGLSDATKEEIAKKIKKRLSKEKRTRRKKIF